MTLEKKKKAILSASLSQCSIYLIIIKKEQLNSWKYLKNGCNNKIVAIMMLRRTVTITDDIYYVLNQNRILY